MFSIGDKIVYPMHGAGVIERIEKSEILGETKNYYILKIPCKDIKIMIPVDNTERVGVRDVVSRENIKEVLSLLHLDSSEMSGNWNRRFRENSEKLKTGEISSVAEVVRNLMRIDRSKKLSTGEKKMLVNAKQILASEIILVCDMDQDTAMELIDNAV